MKEDENCWNCKYRGSIPGNAHIRCDNPSKDLKVEGNEYGIRMGWFMFPICFDPTWLESCNGFERKEKVM